MNKEVSQLIQTESKGNLSLAEKIYSELLKKHPANPDILSGYGDTLIKLKKIDEAIEIYNAALKLLPDNLILIKKKAEALFLNKNFWAGQIELEKYFELKNKIPDEKKIADINKLLYGKKIFCRFDGSVTNLIQFSQLLIKIKTDNNYILLEVPQKLLTLYQSFPWADKVVPSEESQTQQADYEINISELPFKLGIDYPAYSGSENCLFTGKESSGLWKERLSEYKFLRVGINWKNDFANEPDIYNDLKLADLSPILKNEKISFFNLSRAEYSDKEKEMFSQCGIVNFGNQIKDYADWAGLIFNLDLVITTDSLIAHLSAAMGKDTWLLLDYVPDWKWLTEGEKSGWYKQVHIYRQSEKRDWGEIINKVNEDLININKISSISTVLELLPLAKKDLNNNKIEDAIKKYNWINELDENNIDALFGLAYGHQLINKKGKAFEYYSELLKQDPYNVDSLNNCCLILREQKRFEEAEKFINLCYKLNPNNPNTLNTLGLIKEAQGDTLEAKKFFSTALELDSNSVEVNMNMANVLDAEDKFDEALFHVEKALTLNPGNVGAHLNKSLILLKSGNFKDGWDEYEWRTKEPQFPKYNFVQPKLINQNVANKIILVYDEQGFGDSLQFVRYIPELVKAGAKVKFMTKNALRTLFSFSLNKYDVDIYTNIKDVEEDFDFVIPLLSLPGYFSTTLENIPLSVPYLEVEDKDIQLWSEFFGNSAEPRIGFVWQGRKPLDNLKRACTLKDFIPLFENVGAEFVSLQKDEISNDDNLLLKKYNIKNMSEYLKSFYDTAAIMKNLDMVISIDTSVAHLAGALGVETRVLLSSKPDWRWYPKDIKNPWYPSVRTFRQEKLGEWNSVIKSILTSLIN